ncbi:DgyrCDS200 [Dimorphilus gyrociliatus]|uniref:Solute carrier family 25 member 32 n=1 Tax=Dimorphilus gyrociliatus TaxID=2664684 RepID=A0A7I8V551_9ANNE|nr:DgyrCDS200 [Dimorphilus gyrociliatus]
MNVKWEHLAAGVSGGVLSTLVLHPLDLIKIRFQVDEGWSTLQRPQYRGILHAITSIARQEGLSGLYKGVTPNVWGAGSSWGLYFLFYNSFKSHLMEKNQVQTLSAPSHMLIASEAGSLTLLLTNPIWVAKTRLCLQYDALARPTMGENKHTKFIQYRGLFDCVKKIYKHEGVKGLYRGLIPGLFGVSHGALQFMAYEELKKFYNKQKNAPPDAKFTSVEYLTFAALSKIFAASTTYPYQVVRARLQDQHREYAGVMDVIRQTYKLEGLRGFFKGLSPYLLHVTPNICIVFLVYEKVTSRK